MPRVILQNNTHPTPQALQVEYCASFVSRLKGLMFQPAIATHEGILMVQDNENQVNASIHMFFMNFDISVIWLDKQLRVVDAQIARRWQPMIAPRAPAKYILETHPDRLSEYRVGDQIELVSV